MILENDIEKHLKKRVAEKKGMCLKLLPLSMVGIPDRLVLLPGAKLIFIELKRPGKLPTPIQLKRMRQLRDLGFRAVKIDSKEEVDIELCSA